MNEELGARSRGDWLACDVCAEYIRTNQWNRLARRALCAPTVAMLMEVAGDYGALALCMRMHKEFNAHRNGAA
jgi:hypothetical protein